MTADKKRIQKNVHKGLQHSALLKLTMQLTCNRTTAIMQKLISRETNLCFILFFVHMRILNNNNNSSQPR